MFKIISAVAGFIIAGMNIVGAIAGYFIGYLIDNFLKDSPRGASSQQSFDYYINQTLKYDFASMLMVLSAAVMRADGKALKSELAFIKDFFNRQFGNKFTVTHLKVLKYFLTAPNVPLQRICLDIQTRTSIEDRILLLHFLFGIAKADEVIAQSEISVIEQMAQFLGIPQSDFESIKNMFYREPDSDYKILGIDANASEQEIKKAYRQMAMRYHPDKVAHLGEEYQKRAEEKFEEIQKAYENIKKIRGIN